METAPNDSSKRWEALAPHSRPDKALIDALMQAYSFDEYEAPRAYARGITASP